MKSIELKIMIENEAIARDWSTATLCKKAVGNNRLYRTLDNGGSCTLAVAERFVKYIEANPIPEGEAA